MWHSKERRLLGFLLYLLFPLPYLGLRKECIEFYLNSFSDNLHYTNLSLFWGLSLHALLTARDYHRCDTAQELKMVVLVLIPGNLFILWMSLIIMWKSIGPSAEPWGTPMNWNLFWIWFYLFLLNLSLHANNFRNTWSLFSWTSLFNNKSWFTLSKAMERSRRTCVVSLDATWCAAWLAVAVVSWWTPDVFHGRCWSDLMNTWCVVWLVLKWLDRHLVCCITTAEMTWWIPDVFHG